MPYSCKCPCGTTQFEIHGEPMTRFYCHCPSCEKPILAKIGEGKKGFAFIKRMMPSGNSK